MRADISKGGGSDKGNSVNAEYLTDDKNYECSRVIPLEVKEERRVGESIGDVEVPVEKRRNLCSVATLVMMLINVGKAVVDVADHNDQKFNLKL
jgi:hypothetical protein